LGISYKPGSFKLLLDQQRKDFYQPYPKGFRAFGTGFKSDTHEVVTTGLEKLNISGSSQFSEIQLHNILNKIKLENTHITNLYIVDLRQESHGFINELPFRFHKEGNTINIDVPFEEIQKLEYNVINKLSTHKILEIYAHTKDDAHPLGPIAYKFKPEKLHTEREIVENSHHSFNPLGMNIEYKRLHVRDHHHVHPEEGNNFLEFIKTIDLNNTWIHFHCAGGKGRTTSFMAMLDILENGKDISFEEILMRHHYFNGSELLKPNPEYPSGIVRLNYLRNFYDTYASANVR